MLPTYRSDRVLLPVSMFFVWITLIVAVVLSCMPFGRFLAMPDFVALVLTFWCVREPRRIGMGAGFLLGLAMDAIVGSVMGQHATAYVLLAWVAGAQARRLLWFAPGVQMLYLLPLFLMVQIVMLVLRLAAGHQFPGWEYLFTSFTTAALWLPAYYLLILPQLRPIDRDENRPL
ncbi:MAG: rod shape-determining protein MreD [Candidatus Dactylopiibacterium sp.]|nr:rod shape-determining protein MreD [Candidatus Dactylopiibacterium sp.]